MTPWSLRPVSELCSHIVDCVNKTAPTSDTPTQFKMLRTTNVRNGWIDTANVRFVNEATFERWTRRMRPQRGDVVLTREAPLGEVGILRTDEQVFLGQRLVMYRVDPAECDADFLLYSMLGPTVQAQLRSLGSGATVEHLRVPDCERLTIPCPALPIQRRIGSVLRAFDDLIENNRRRVELLEAMARAIYREWFVYFRYPAHQTAKFVHSQLGPIPEGWGVATVAALASSSDRNAVTGGPFGSKLGRKDYVDEGVPVIRGTNLSIGGGFDESGLVFVSDRKAGELRSSIARPGDVVVTQRGTLGQIGLIPRDAGFDRYVLSQSQMKITVDPEKSTPEFVYSQMRSPETTLRFIARAMSSGVPHVNLQLLRDFELINPPFDLQVRYSDCVRTLNSQSWALLRQADRVSRLRDLLLPKLVKGQIDVSSLDLDALVEDSVA